MGRVSTIVRLGGFLILLSAVCCLSSGETLDHCRQISLDPRLEYTFSAAWMPQNDGFLIADYRNQRILHYDLDGELEREIKGSGSHRFVLPGQVYAREDGFWVKDGPERFLFFDRDFKPTRSLDLRPPFVPVPYREGLESLAILEQALAGDEIYGFGYARTVERAILGFHRVHVGESIALEAVVEEIDPYSNAQKFHNVSGPEIAEAGEEIYGLLFTDPPGILRLSPPAGRLASFPGAFLRLPRMIEAPGNLAGSAQRFNALETMKAPTALYGWGDLLYLVTRRPGAGERTLWELHAIDPEADRLLRTLVLPTVAPHIILAPGAEFWLIVEKGRVDPEGWQEISTALLVPASWFVEPTSPLTGEGAVVCEKAG